MAKTTISLRRGILNPIEELPNMPNTAKLYVGSPEENKFFLIDNDPGLIHYITQNVFKWTFDNNSNKNYGLLSASNEECKEIYGKTTIRLHQLIFQYYFGDTEEFKEYKAQEYSRSRSKQGKLVIEHLNNNEIDNRIQNLHITTQQQNKNKSILDEMIDYNKCYISYPKNEEGQRIYAQREYIVQFNNIPGLFFNFGDKKEACNTFAISFEATEFEEYLEAVEKISTLTKNFLQKTEEAKEIRKLVKEADQEEKRTTFSRLLENKTSSVKDLERERTENIQELVNGLYATMREKDRVESFLIMPVINTITGTIDQMRIKRLDDQVIKIINVDPGKITNENICEYLKEFNFADYFLN